MNLLYIISQLIAMAFVRVFFPPMTHLKVEGKQYIKNIDEPVILIANHNSRLDPVYMSAFLPNHLYKRMMPFRFMTLKKTMRKLRSIPGLYLVGCYAVEPGSGPLERVLEKSMKILSKGENALVMFPDSPLHKTVDSPKAKPGIAYLGKHSKRLIIPIGLSNSKKIGVFSFWTARVHLTMRFDKPFYYNDIAEEGEDLQKTAQKMMDRVYNLID